MKERVAAISIAANIILAGAKITIGLISNSVAVLADGIHSLTDVFASAVSLFGIRAAKKPADQKHPYGHYKFEVLAAVIITLIILVTGLVILWEAYKSFLKPQEIQVEYLALGVTIFSVIVSEVMARLKIHFGKKENSIALLSDGFHSRADCFSSLAVIAGLILTRYWPFADATLAVLIGAYIIKMSFSLGKEAVDSLLDVSAGEEIEERIKSIAKAQNIEISSLKTQKKGAAVTASLEIELPSNLMVEEAAKRADNLREKLMQEIKNLSYVATQIKSHEVSTGFYRPAFGRGFGWQRRGRFEGEVKEARQRGPGGYCVCSKCGYKIPHERGVPCSTLKCPECNTNLSRE